MLGISKLLFLSAVLCVPKWVISKVNNLVWPFLWGSRIEMVSQMTCHQSLKKGGLGIFNFKTKSNSQPMVGMRSVYPFRLHCLPLLIFLLFLNDLLLLSCYPPPMPPHLALMTCLLLTFPRLFHLC